MNHLKQYRERPSLAFKVFDNIEKAIERGVDMTDILTPIQLVHCIRCHKMVCLEDKDDVCMIKHHGKYSEPEVEEFVSELSVKVTFEGCGCTVVQDSPYDACVIYNLPSDNTDLLKRFDKEQQHCHNTTPPMGSE